jgi:hypothetical protein
MKNKKKRKRKSKIVVSSLMFPSGLVTVTISNLSWAQTKMIDRMLTLWINDGKKVNLVNASKYIDTDYKSLIAEDGEK